MSPLTLDTPDCVDQTEANLLSTRNLRANLDALIGVQPGVVDAIPALEPDLTWVFARDGFLSVIEPGERWHTGCSVPLLAARAMLKTLDSAAGVACFLNPLHAAQIRVALDRLESNQAIICIAPDTHRLAVILRCENFSPEVLRGRLWFACGEQWPDALADLLVQAPGLPTPTRFIRMPDAEPGILDRLIFDAQRVFAEQGARRTASIAALRKTWSPRAWRKPRVCVIARSTFRLWDDAGRTLLDALTIGGGTSLEVARFDPDAPAGSSPLALATIAAASDAVVAADTSRNDVHNLLPNEMPWITWVTSGRIPKFSAAGPFDRLLLADPTWRDAAVRSGWPAGRITAGEWPRPIGCPEIGRTPADQATPPFLALVADTCGLDAPEALSDYSSHGLLWDRLRRAISRDPFTVPDDVWAWLGKEARADGIAEGTLDANLFVSGLIIPAFQQALADILLTAGLPLRLYGAGWTDLPRFREHAAGNIKTHTQLLLISEEATAFVHAWPTMGVHPIDALARPVVRHGARKESLVRQAKLALARQLPAQPCPAAPVSASLVASLLSQHPADTCGAH